MATHSLPARHNRPTNDELHPWIYRAIIGLTIWLVLSVIFLFSRGAYASLDVAVITFFFAVLVGTPLLIWTTWRHNTDPNEQHGYVAPFREWKEHSFETWTGALSGRSASTQILLPIAAVAFGMTLFGFVFLFTIPQLGAN
jgi:hypothetical protein